MISNPVETWLLGVARDLIDAEASQDEIIRQLWRLRFDTRDIARIIGRPESHIYNRMAHMSAKRGGQA